MGARELLADLAVKGVSVTADGDRLVVRPASKLTGTMLVALREAKSDLLALLSPFRLTHEQGDRCHAPCWDDAEIAIFSARVRVLMRRGIGTDDADDLAERLTLRDREGDDQRICIECSQLSDKGRCIAAATGRLAGADTRLEPVQTILHGCDAFELRKGLA